MQAVQLAGDTEDIRSFVGERSFWTPNGETCTVYEHYKGRDTLLSNGDWVVKDAEPGDFVVVSNHIWRLLREH